MHKAYAILDLQYGSTGKGAVAGFMAKKYKPDTLVTAWSANAGHSFISADGTKYVHSMIANGIVSPNVKHLLIGPGSILDVNKFMDEVASIPKLANGEVKILIHPNAAVITPIHKEIEFTSMIGIGSTLKGCGEATIDKIRRKVDGTAIAKKFLTMCNIHHPDVKFSLRDLICTQDEYDQVVDNANLIQIEGCQGYSLGINSGFYPYVTSRECTITQLLSDTRIPPSIIYNTIGVARTYPIRVANRYGNDGNIVGYSGPCYPDQEEISFEELGVPVEYTTVTKLPRRIFTWSNMQFREALRMNWCTDVVITFMDYIKPDYRKEFLQMVSKTCEKFNSKILYTSYGPKETDMRTGDELYN